MSVAARPRPGHRARRPAPRVHLAALGCRLNEAELQAWARDFRARGWNVTPDPQGADLIVVNSCAVTAEAVRKSRQLLRRSRRDNPSARLVVSGCATALPESGGVDLGAVDLLVSNGDKDRLVEIACERLGLSTVSALATEPAEAGGPGIGRSRAFVKAQDGCRYRCAFCVVTLARGQERSRSIEAVVEEVRHLVAADVQEVVLTGVHLGGYGSDRATDLPALVQAVLRDTSLARLRMGSLEPWDLDDRLFALFDDPRLLPHLHLPLQSGADSVLRRMSRRGRASDYERLVEQARSAVPGMAVSTDIIVGFPGETDREWRQTVSLCERLGLARLHVFPYSPRPGTRAAALPDQVPDALRRARANELLELDARLRRDALQRAVGGSAAVLWESCDEVDARTRRWYGYTPDYLRVATDQPVGIDLGNRIVTARIERHCAETGLGVARLEGR